MNHTRMPSLLLSLMLGACGGGSGTQPAGPGPAPVPASLPVPDLGSVARESGASTLPPGWQRGAFMEIYVRSYKDSDGDGVGDLRGLISKLDYLADLGIKGIWLMPVTQSADLDHGYAVQNYRAIESSYGTMADFDELLVQAHARGIGVIIDYVINHSSAQHPLFRNAASAPSAAQRDYYIWQSARPAGWNIYGADPWHTGPGANGYFFGGFNASMPDFNLNNPAVIQFHHDNLRFWLNKGVDGMRFDAVGHLLESGPSAWDAQPGNHVVMAAVRELFDAYSQRYMVCEAPSASRAFAGAGSCGSAFAFDVKDAIIGAVRGNVASIDSLSRYFSSAPAGMAVFASNHDSFAGDRLWNQLNGDIARYKLVAASYLLLPGTPFIYYGEEVGMARGAGVLSDHNLRTPMSWTADNSGFSSAAPFRQVSENRALQNVVSQVGVEGSLHSHYKALLALRARLPAIAGGSYEAAVASGLTMHYQRTLGRDSALIVFNYGNAEAVLSVNALPANTTLKSELGRAPHAYTDHGGSVMLTLAPLSVAVYSVRHD